VLWAKSETFTLIGEKKILYETPVKNNFIGIDNISIFHSRNKLHCFLPKFILARVLTKNRRTLHTSQCYFIERLRNPLRLCSWKRCGSYLGKTRFSSKRKKHCLSVSICFAAHVHETNDRRYQISRAISIDEFEHWCLFFF